MTTPITAGDLEPNLVITIGDKNGDADFNDCDPAMVTFIGERAGAEVMSLGCSEVVPSVDGLSAEVHHRWVDGETDNAGRYFMTVEVEWEPGRIQTFPANGHVVLEIQEA